MSRAASIVGTSSGLVWMSQIFLLSLMVPFAMRIGPLFLMPHRAVLLVLFIPLLIMLFSGRAGRVIWSDWLLMGATIWSVLALIANHGFGVIEPIGIHVLEFFGAYLLARVTIRSSADFRRMVWTVFAMILFLTPFAAAESILKRPILLDLLPGNAIAVMDIGGRMGLRRAQTVFAHPILYGVFVSTGLGLFWYALKPRGLRFFAGPLSAVATFFSLSTGALISLVMQSIFIGWEMVLRSVKRRWRLFAILSVVGYIAIDLLSNRTPFHVLVTYASFYQGSAYGRIVIWNHGIENVAANPIFGLGLREWVRPGWLGPSVDNFWLAMTMRFGVPFMAMMAAGILLIMRRVSLALLSDTDERMARAAYLTAVGGLIVAGGTVHFWHAMLAFVMFIFGSGVWSATSGGDPSEETVEEAADDVPPPARSRYTRQSSQGGRIATARRPTTARQPAVNRSLSARQR